MLRARPAQMADYIQDLREICPTPPRARLAEPPQAQHRRESQVALFLRPAPGRPAALFRTKAKPGRWAQ